MSAVILRLDDYRRSVAEFMRCLWCGRKFWLRHPRDDRPGKYWGGCPGCDEEAALPAWRVEGWE